MRGRSGDGAPARLVVPAPAKVNLFLHVTGRRADGYHELETPMAFIDLADTVELAVRDDDRIVRTRPLEGVAEDDDLTIRAARLLARATGTRRGVDIGVVKCIPQGGGLGGGSSDAASVLLALNRMWALDLPRAELLALGMTLGADVPVFVGGRAALARGIGERLTPLTLPPLWLVLARPATSVPTAAVFASPNLTRSTPSAKIDVFSEGYGRNDLQPVVVDSAPLVADAIAALAQACAATGLAAGAIRMSGSGACAYATFASEAAAARVAARLPDRHAGLVTRVMATHPLAGFARDR